MDDYITQRIAELDVAEQETETQLRASDPYIRLMAIRAARAELRALLTNTPEPDPAD